MNSNRMISHYRLLYPIGRGGMGEVYAAHDETLKRRVALKAIHKEHRLNAYAKARFLREAQILSQLDHPNACRVYDYVEDGESDWLVLELIEGKNLHLALAEGPDLGARLRIAEQVAQVLVAVHAAGIVHRDLKPGNVMVGRTGEVKVLDFGLARSDFHDREIDSVPTLGITGGPIVPVLNFSEKAPDLDANARVEPTVLWDPTAPTEPAWVGTSERGGISEFRTEQGAVMGTVAYMSPEQARGEVATTASDMYSFGLMLQELFTGRPPYDSGLGRPALLEAARRGESPAPIGLNGELTELILRLKSLAPSQRPTAFDTLERLRWILAKPKRRIRRLVIAGAVVTIAIAATKYTTDLAYERTEAVAARSDADRRRTQAEDLIGFMLGDLRKRLEAVGRLEILDEVGVKAMNYFAAVPAASLSDEELLKRSTALYQIGSVRVSQGSFEAATRSLEESLVLSTALVARQPNDGNRLYEQAQSEYWVGYVHWRRGNLDIALQHFRQYLNLANRLVLIDPNKSDWQLELAYANSNIGSVHQERGELEDAQLRFRACLEIEQRLSDRNPGNAESKRAVAASHNTLGVVLTIQGRLAEALRHHEEELKLQQELVRLEPGDTRWRLYYAVSLHYVAAILEAQGQLSPALAHLESARSIYEELARGDPANMEWQRELGRNQYRLGLAWDAGGDSRRALDHLRRAAVVLGGTAAKETSDAGWQRDLADARNGLGQLYVREGNLEGAVLEVDAAMDIADRLLRQGPSDWQSTRIRSTSLNLRGRIWEARHEREQALKAWQEAEKAIVSVARNSRDYHLLEPWAISLLKQGRMNDAMGVVSRLVELGYRHPVFVSEVVGQGLKWPENNILETVRPVPR